MDDKIKQFPGNANAAPKADKGPEKPKFRSPFVHLELRNGGDGYFRPEYITHIEDETHTVEDDAGNAVIDADGNEQTEIVGSLLWYAAPGSTEIVEVELFEDAALVHEAICAHMEGLSG